MNGRNVKVPPSLELADLAEERHVERRLEGASFEDPAGLSPTMLGRGWQVVPLLGRYFPGNRSQRIVATMRSCGLKTIYGYLIETFSGYGRCYRMGSAEAAFHSFQQEFGVLQTILVAECFVLYLPPEDFSVVAGPGQVVESIGGASVRELRTAFAGDAAKTRDREERRMLETVDAQCRALSTP